MRWFGLPLPADVNRTPRGGGVPVRRTHTALSRAGSRFSSCLRSSVEAILSGDPSGSSIHSSGCSLFHVSDTQLPLLKNLPTITTLYRCTLWAIRTQSTVVSWAKFFHRLTESLWTAPSWEFCRQSKTISPVRSDEDEGVSRWYHSSECMVSNGER